ncbi:TRAP transporter substrate-binding protein DctP [Bradyrhizobium brasilense]|uniref:TRAP transporter substrate-binding protein DctP n=1 Tax=Bradyrhizobium brasilense TaxID=1419277 RepID=UPI0024B22CB9|nr:TRAP transporter substrate-binding protein DctP [Bradyrhizobium australafricanum]WFU34557.1 TRAP transporter substrate-binding protein DctP [Bradyrhizobium australafricanum]
MKRGAVTAVLAVLAIQCSQGALAAEPQFKLRASVDTSAAHGRTLSAADYLKKLQEKSGGRITTELFHSGQLFRDRDVVKALRQGAVEMAIPGTWVLTGFVPDADVFQLPAFFGQPYPVVYAAADGKIGEIINKQFESKLDVKLLGPWLQLGYQNTYSTNKAIRDFADQAGMKIRNSGGAGQSARAKFFNATPNVTAWPDVPLALSQGTFDGLSSTDESLASAKLWESGVKYGFADREFVGFYVPMISESFYKKLPPDLQKLVIDLWQENIQVYRKSMEEAQTEARHTLEKNGIVFVSPSESALAEVRAKMLPLQDSIAKELRISPALLQQVQADVTTVGH